MHGRVRLSAGLAVAATAAAVLLLLGCGSSHRTRATAPVVHVKEADFHISAPGHLKAGTVTLQIHNEGPDQHELIVVRTDGKPLPLRPDGLTVDEEAIEQDEPGSLEPGEPGAVRDLTVHLTPGRYIFFCNMEGHFMGGMHTEVVVQ